MLEITYTGKRKRGEVVGTFTFGGKEISPLEVFYTEEIKGLDSSSGKGRNVADALAWGRCVVASSCSFSGVCTRSKDWLNFTANDNPYDLYASTMSEPKWHPITTYWEHSKPSSTAIEMIESSFVPNTYIRSVCRDFVPDRYLNYYDGSYINSKTDLDGYLTGLDKLEGFKTAKGVVLANDNLTDPQFLSATLLFLDKLDYYRSNLPLAITEEVALFNYCRSFASYGFDAFAQDTYGKKGHFKKIHRSHVKWILYQVMRKGKSWEDALPYAGFVFATKPEIRGPEVAASKIRYTQTNNMITDWVYELQLRPVYNWLKALPCYLGGVSVRHNQIAKILRAIRHPYAVHFYHDPEVYSGPCAIVCEDLGSQDCTFSNRNKHLFTMIMATLFQRSPDVHLQKRIDELFAYTSAYNNLSLVEFWGGNWYLTTGNNPTGHKWTAIMAFLMALWNSYAGAVAWRPNDYIEILNWIWSVYFGDDRTSRMPVAVAKSFYGRSLQKYSNFVREELGINIKADGSAILYPTLNHKDRVFTHVINDEIVSEGLFMLKRRIIKIDDKCNPVHPDSKHFKALALWRPTSDYVSRFALDVDNWGYKDDRMWIKWFRKQFGLIIDCGANRTVHNMIKSAVLSVRKRFSDQWDIAVSGMADSQEYAEHCLKMGKIPAPLMSELFDLEDSFAIVCALYIPWSGEAQRLETNFYNIPSAWCLPK